MESKYIVDWLREERLTGTKEYDDAADLIESLEARIAEQDHAIEGYVILSGLNQAERQKYFELQARVNELEGQIPRWIPVSERLPDKGVFCAIFGWRYGYAYRSDREWDELGTTHWMPLPEPPQEQGQ